MIMRSALGRARGLGSAKEGVGHWWVQRLTGLALVPLALWLVISVIRLSHSDYDGLHLWFARPGNATLMILLIIAAFHHAQLGMQVVIEDYVPKESAKLTALILVKFLAMLLGTFSVVSVLKLAFGG